MKAVKTAVLAVLFMAGIMTLPLHELTAKAAEKQVGKETKGSETVVRKYLLNDNEQQQAYDQVFKIGSDEIKSFSANGGNYASSVIGRAFDGNLQTHWETAKPNSKDFTNEIEVAFQDSVALNRIVYAARRDAGGKGFATEFEIQASEQDSGNDFTVIATGKYTGSLADVIEIEFPETTMKRLKFVFKQATQDWASAAELRFYKQDSVTDDINRLFTDQSYSKVSEEFNTLKVLNGLEEKVKGHPLEEQYTVWINDAKRLLENDFTATKEAKVSRFDHYGHQLYTDQYQMSYDNVKSIRNNGGHYASQVIQQAIDQNPATYWETRSGNSANFNNEVEVEFKEAVRLGSLVYGARGSDSKGFAEEFDIYVSQTSRGDTYKLLTTGKHQTVGGFVRAQFEPTTFQRVKFKFKKSNQNWATLSELAFYQEDPILDKVNNLFTDGTMSAVVKEFDSIAKLNALDNEAKNHPLYSVLKEQIDLAKDLINGKVEMEGHIITAEQRGNMKQHAGTNLRMTLGTNYQPAGMAAKPGDKVVVYLESHSSLHLPSLTFTQQEGSWSSWSNTVRLTPGKNVITVPKIAIDGNYHNEVTPGGPIYIVNPYTPEEQGKAPILRFEGAERIPLMTENTDPEAFKSFLTSYKKRVDEDKAKHPAAKDRELIDVAEMASEHIIYTGTTTAAHRAYVTGSNSPMGTLKGYDQWMREIFDFYNLDGRSDLHDAKRIRENIRLMQPWGFMYAAGSHIGIQSGQESLMFTDFRQSYPGWGLNHEVGHRMAVGEREYGEVTNNMVSMWMSVVANRIDNRIPFENEIYKNVIEENKVPMQGFSGAGQLAVYWQLELAHPGYWGELNSLYRERKVSLPNGDNSKQQYLIEFSSEVLGMDLSSHFARHGFTVNPETKEKVSKYREPTKTWYLNNTVLNYEGNGLSKDLTVDVSIKSDEENQSNTLTFTMDEKAKDDLLGYEIYRNGELIGFTSTNQFVDRDRDTSKNDTYQVVAFDKKLKTQEPVELQAFKPSLSVEEYVTLKLRQAYDPLDYANAETSKGKDITDKIAVKSSNVDIKKKGTYEIVYEVKDEGITETKTSKVTVTSDYTYLSDMNASSADIQWGGLKKDVAPSGNKITLIRQGLDAIYPKGLGTHANSEVVYDIDGKDFDFFESYIGIDQEAKGLASSATFEVWVDDEKKFTSNVFKSNTEHQFIRVPLTDAKQVKLVTTDAKNSGNTADHTVWASAKLTRNSSNPELTIPDDIATKLGQPVELDGSYKARDQEDGDLTDQVIVTGKDRVNFDKVGKYKVTYTVTDRDGNMVRKQRTISVVDMDGFEYLSDFDWSSETHSFAAPKKDQSTSDNALRLTDKDGNVVSYQKGLGTHANATITYDLTKIQAAYLSSYVGVDRQMYDRPGSVVFQVFVDDKELFNSGLMRSTDPQKYFEVDVSGGKELKIVVNDGGNGNGSDHATWGDAKFYFSGEEQIATVVDKIDSNQTVVTGITRPNTTVTLLNKDKEVIGEALVQEDGNIQVDIEKQKVGTVVTVLVKDQEGQTLDSVDVVVEKATVDTSVLAALIDDAKDYLEEDYTAESFAALQKQIGLAEKVVGDAQSNEEVTAAIDELQKAMDGLVSNTQPEIDTSELEKLLEHALVYSKEQYTAESFAVVEKAIQAGQATVAKPKSQEDVEKAIAQLKQAIEGLQAVENPRPDPTPEIDTTALKNLIDQAKIYSKDTYTAESFGVLQESIRLGESIIAQPSSQDAVTEGIRQLKAAITGLVAIENPAPEIDTTELEKLIAQAKLYQQDQYTQDSFASLQSAMTNGQAIVTNPESQEAVTAGVLQLQEAITSLVRVEVLPPEPEIDVTALERLIAQAKVYQEELYTTESFAGLQTAINKGQSIVTNPESQEAVTAGLQQLQSAIQDLVRLEPPTEESEIDLSELEKLLAQAKTYDEAEYTKASYEGLQTAIAAGDTVIENPTSQVEVVQAIDQLTKALMGLEKLTPPTEEPTIDTRELESLLAHAKSFAQADYTAESYAALTAAISAGESVLGSATTQEEVIKATDQLTAALVGLKQLTPPTTPEPELDKTELEKLLTHAKTYQPEDYTAESHAALIAAISAGEATLENATTQAEIVTAINQLTTALIELEMVAPPIEGPDVDKEPSVDTSELVKLIEHAKTYEQSLYTEKTFTQLQSVIDQASTVVENATTQKEVNEAIQQLSSAILGLEKVEVSTPDPEPDQDPIIDTAELEQLLAQAKTYRQRDYTKDTYATLQKAIQAGESALANGKTAEDIETAVQQLTDAMKQLVKVTPPNEDQKIDTVELETLIEQATTYEQEAYTKESFTQLQQAIEQAMKTVREATMQNEIDQSIKQLQVAIAGLEKVERPRPNPEVSPGLTPEVAPEVAPEKEDISKPSLKPDSNVVSKAEKDQPSQLVPSVEVPQDHQGNVNAEDGFALPKTATETYNALVLGLLFITLSIAVYIRRSRRLTK